MSELKDIDFYLNNIKTLNFDLNDKNIKLINNVYEFIKNNIEPNDIIEIDDFLNVKTKNWTEMIYNWLYGGNKSNNCAACVDCIFDCYNCLGCCMLYKCKNCINCFECAGLENCELVNRTFNLNF